MSRDSVGEIVMSEIDAIPQHKQTQASITAQLTALSIVANRFGMYDAADFIMRTLVED